MNTTEVAGVEYAKPKVFLMQDTGIGTAEFAARTAYDSFDKSNSEPIKELNEQADFLQSDDDYFYELRNDINEVYESDLLDKLAWTYFHHSVLEHASLTFLIKSISRGVLQELARHRIASYTVRSTRYTMATVLNAYNASWKFKDARSWFVDTMIKENMLVTTNAYYQRIEWTATFEKLAEQVEAIGPREFLEMTVSKKMLDVCENEEDGNTLFRLLNDGPSKRNVGDNFKHIVTDNWKVDAVMTINLRSYKNFLQLRDSGSAWFQIRWLAQAMKEATPSKYLKLIVKTN